MAWSAGKTYHVRTVVNVATLKYSVFVTPPGAAEVSLASNFATDSSFGSAAIWQYALLAM